MNEPSVQYGQADTSFRAAGGEDGIRQLVDRFYARMGSDKRFERIFRLHPAAIDTSVDKLARFLNGWLGGPRSYQATYGSLSIPLAHQHLPVDQDLHDQWLTCMAESVDEQPFPLSFKAYLMAQLRVPAAAILKRCTETGGTRQTKAPFGVRQP